MKTDIENLYLVFQVFGKSEGLAQTQLSPKIELVKQKIEAHLKKKLSGTCEIKLQDIASVAIINELKTSGLKIF